MLHSSNAARVLLASALVLACGGVDDPEGEPPSAPTALAGAGGAGQGLGGSPTTTAPPAQGGQGGAEASNDPPPAAGGAGGDSSFSAPVFCNAPAKVFVPSCGGGSCHSNAGATIGDFAVDAQRAYNYVDKLSVRHADCGRIIDSENYSKSFLLQKIRGDFQTPYCGGIMPVPSFPPLSEDQIDCVASWLQQFQH